MTRRVGVSALVILAMAGLTGPEVLHAEESRKPNIVLVFMDNFGWGEPGFNGGGVIRGTPTPRMDKLASEGLRLTNFNVEAQCTPSRSAIMTGRYAIRSGNGVAPLGQRRLRTRPVGSHDGGDALRGGLRHGHVRQVAPRSDPGSVAVRSGLRRVVRHPQLDGRVGRTPRYAASRRAASRRPT